MLAETAVEASKPGSRNARPGAPDAAFDLWLQRGLHAMYDGIAKEPIPDELLRLIEQDRPGGATKPSPDQRSGGKSSGSDGA